MTSSPIQMVRTQATLPTPDGPMLYENNVWVIGNDTEVIVIDASHDAGAIADAIAGRTVRAVLLTHGHRDHINQALALAERTGAELYLNPADEFLWYESHPGTSLPRQLREGATFTVGETELQVRHTPGHTPGSTSLVAAAHDVVFSGDTLFEGGPGATRWEYSSFSGIIDSISQKLLTLPAHTKVLTGHGNSTTVADELSQLQHYIERGW